MKLILPYKWDGVKKENKMMLSALLGSEAVFEDGATVLVLDEIQDCPEARTALEFFRIDGRYDMIGEGFLLGVKGYGREPMSILVGSENVIDMYPLDFEEFLWVNGIIEPILRKRTNPGLRNVFNPFPNS